VEHTGSSPSTLSHIEIRKSSTHSSSWQNYLGSTVLAGTTARGICGGGGINSTIARQSLVGSGLPRFDKTTREPKRFMAIITAPVLLNGE